MYRRMSFRMAASRRSSASRNLQLRSLGSLLLIYFGARSKVSANKTDTGTSSPACVCSCPAPTQNQTRWYAEKLDTVVFFWNHAPNTRLARNPRRGSPAFFPTFVQTASLLSALSCLALFFRKRTLLFAVLENTLDSNAKGRHGTETKCLFPYKNHPLDVLDVFFPYRDHTFDSRYANPSTGRRVPSNWLPFPHTLPGHKTLYPTHFRAAGFALLCTPLRSLLSYKPLHAAADCMLA